MADKYQCVLVSNGINKYGILKNGCTVELYLGDKDHQITIHNLRDLECDNIKYRLDIELTNEHTARSLHEVLESVLCYTDDEVKHEISIDVKLTLDEPMYIEVKKDNKLIYHSTIRDMNTEKEK